MNYGMKYRETFHLPSGRIFLFETEDGSLVESTEMQDVTLEGKEPIEVRSSLDPRVVWRHLVPKTEKWLMTVSTQKGCVHNCRFCDVAPLPFRGNLSEEEILEQFFFMMRYTPLETDKEYRKLKLGFSRMGEPAWNLKNVISAMYLIHTWCQKRNIRLLPCFNSILPRKLKEGTAEEVIREILDFKNEALDGFLHFQISCNSTDEGVRKDLFGGADVLPLEDVIRHVNSWSGNTKGFGRTVTLNFIVMEGVPVDVSVLKKYGLNPERFTVKLIPLNTTNNSRKNELETLYNYNTYDELRKLAGEFRDAGIPVVYDAVAKCEEAGLCCGQLAQVFSGRTDN